MNASVFSPDPQCVVLCFFAVSPIVEHARPSVVRFFYRNLCGFYLINTDVSYGSQGVFM